MTITFSDWLARINEYEERERMKIDRLRDLVVDDKIGLSWFYAPMQAMQMARLKELRDKNKEAGDDLLPTDAEGR